MGDAVSTGEHHYEPVISPARMAAVRMLWRAEWSVMKVSGAMLMSTEKVRDLFDRFAREDSLKDGPETSLSRVPRAGTFDGGA
ncbi:MAG: hypothetical protein AAF739_00400 [Pseudomonadota bacterium]